MGMAYTPEKKITVVTGHFGSGKTNIAVNMALDFAISGKSTAIVDFDTVNPYFRAADSKDELEAAGVRCVIPAFANTNVDIPALPAEIYSVFGDTSLERVIFDVGGDDSGATALGAYRDYFERVGYEMLFVLSMYRPITAEPTGTVELLREVESRSRLRVTALVNNSNIGRETTADDVRASEGYIAEISRLTGLPVAFTSALGGIMPPGSGVYELKNITKKIYGG